MELFVFNLSKKSLIVLVCYESSKRISFCCNSGNLKKSIRAAAGQSVVFKIINNKNLFLKYFL